MVDFQSKQRVHWFGYKATVFPEPSCSYREQYHVQDRKTFPAHINLAVHDCRAEVVQDLNAPTEWEACLLLPGLRATYCDVFDSHDKKGSNTPTDQKEDKLLYKLGAKGSKNGEFNYPRGLCTTVEGDIVVADSKNHRVQVLSGYGVFKFAFGQHGTDIGKFDEPTGVTELPDRNLAVADRKNRRVQVFSEKGKFCYTFSTMNEPYDIAADHCDIIAVASVTRLVEIYQARDCTLVSHFLVPVISGCRQNGNCPYTLACLSRKL
ncbi:B-box type zinc finger protein ncl-1-like [Pomacea canaliculata]|uniref:B-box type zinc finger protein ncl-1-like n=1 Tax=Pomacea canaliculata TaxID=400727 RepID=UPI000D72BA18|nr:B-box type zinc finger protein ncl-1-like [Pomacea canaliculata]XP_025099656.1 B-box type zinc finger protein ncl-1-like [Pomacea canaliculata]